MDSDDDLPCIKFSHSKVPLGHKNDEATACSNVTEQSSIIGFSSMATAAESSVGGMVVVDLDSSDSDSWKECTFKYDRNLRERCNVGAALSSADYAEGCSSQLGVDLATVLATDDQSCGSSLTDSSSAAWKSYENSEDFASQQLTQTTTDVNSQTSVESDDKRRRKRPQKADDAEAVVHAS